MSRVKIIAVAIGKNYWGIDVLRLKIEVEGEGRKSITVNYKQKGFNVLNDATFLEKLEKKLGGTWDTWLGKVLENVKIAKRGRCNTLLLED
jgi:hypothetical protein